MPEQPKQPEQDTSRAIPVVFVGAEETPILFVNQFVSQFQEDEFVLTLGQLTPPIILGSDEQKQHQLAELGYIPVKVVARFAFTRARLEELIQVLNMNLDAYDRQGEQDAEIDLQP